MKRVLIALLVVVLLFSFSAALVSAKPDKAGRPEKLEQIIFVHPVAPDKPGKPDTPPGKPPKEEEPKDNTYYELWGGWLDSTIDYYINPNINLVTGEDADDTVNALNNAAEAWDSVTFDELFDCVGETTKSWYEEDEQNTVSWVKFIPRDYIAIAAMWYDPETLIIYEVDIVFNALHKWGINPTKKDRAFDVQNIATHEFGHPVGLDDLYDEIYSELTMYGYSSKGEIEKCSLEEGDIDGAQSLYGSPQE